MFRTITYLKSGTEVQRRAYDAINQLRILHDLQEHSPLLCGTIPICIDIAGSDLDIVLEAHDFVAFQEELKQLYGSLPGFRLTELTVKEVPTVTCNFWFCGFDFELFAQPKPVDSQDAYLHMLIEHCLLGVCPQVREEIIRLKQSGMKTEPAFARVFGLSGDPYRQLLILGAQLGVIETGNHY